MIDLVCRKWVFFSVVSAVLFLGILKVFTSSVLERWLLVRWALELTCGSSKHKKLWMYNWNKHRLSSKVFWLKNVKYNHFEDLGRMIKITWCIFIFRVLTWCLWIFGGVGLWFFFRRLPGDEWILRKLYWRMIEGVWADSNSWEKQTVFGED